MMKFGIIVLTLLMAPLAGLAAAHAAGAPATVAPEVIAPGNLPILEALPPDYGATVVAQGSYRPAPMPDADASAPAIVPDEETQLKPALYGQKATYLGDGYSNGSSDHARAVQPATGVALNVPLN